MRKKRLAAGLLTAALTLGAAVIPVQAVTFSDVPAHAWYASDVYEVQAYGILEGTGNGCFSPDSTLTLAQAITMAVRTYNEGQGITFIFPTGISPWYSPYVDYAAEHGICALGEFGTDYNDACSRKVMAELFARVFPEDTASDRNEIDSLPDVDNTEENAAIYYLYRQGVLTGSDAYGTFYPDNDIKRSETAAILNRVLNPEKRKDVTLQPPAENKLLYDEAMTVFLDNYGDELAMVSDEVGATLADVNGDGTDELLVGFVGRPDNILAIYTVMNDEAVNLCLAPIPNAGGYWETYFLAGNGFVGRSWRSGASSYGADYNAIDMINLSLFLVESYQVEYTQDGTRINWYSNRANADASGGDAYEKVSDAFLQQVVAQYTIQNVVFEPYVFG